VADAAEFSALAPVHAGVADRELEGIHSAGNRVLLVVEGRHVEGVDDVGRRQVDLDGLVDRQDHLRGAIRGAEDRNAFIRIVELPLELKRRHVDGERRALTASLDLVQRLPREREQPDDDRQRNDGPDRLGEVVAVDLGRERVVAGPPAIADDRIDDQPSTRRKIATAMTKTTR
jgi:hypothetical protein